MPYDHQMSEQEKQERWLRVLQRRAEDCDLNLDANETAMLDKELRYVESTVYQTEYPELTHRSNIPIDNSVPEGAETVMYKIMDQIRNAKLIGSYSDDLPRVDLIAREFNIPVKGIGNSFEYSQRDLQHAAFSGTPLDTMRAQVARDSIEQELDDIAYFGRPSVQIRGFANNEFVSVMSPIADPNASNVTAWATKTPQGIVKDLMSMKKQTRVDTKSLYAPNTYLFPTDLFEILGNTPWNSANSSDRSLLEYLRANNPGVEFKECIKLDKANAAGTAGRIISYFKDPRVVKEKIPMEFRSLPPQARNLAFIINNWALTAGTHIYVPPAFKYMDGAN